MKILLTVVLLTIAHFGFSQERIPVSSVTKDWTLIKSEKGLNFYVKSVDETVFEGKKPLTYVLVKIENTTANNAKALYNLAAFYTEGCQNCGMSQEARKLIEIPATSSIEGVYDSGNCPTSVLLVNPNNPLAWHPEAIAIENLIINF